MKNIKIFKWSGVAMANEKYHRKAEEYQVTLSLKVITSGGIKSAKIIFTNMVRSNPYNPFLNLKVDKLNKIVKK